MSLDPSLFNDPKVEDTDDDATAGAVSLQHGPASNEYVVFVASGRAVNGVVPGAWYSWAQLQAKIGPGTTPPTPTAPGPITGLELTPGNGALTANWSVPNNPGSSPITGYVVEHGGVSNDVTGTEVTISGLVNGDATVVTVAAVNSVGTGPAVSGTGTPAGPVVDPPPPPPTGELTLAQVAAMVDPKFSVKVFDIDYTVENPPAITTDWILGAEGAAPYKWPANYDSGNGYDIDTPAAVAIVPGVGLQITTTRVSATDYSSMMLSNYGIHPTAVGIPTIHLQKLKRPDVNSGMWPAKWHLPDSTAPVKNNEGYAEIDDWEGGINNFATAVNTGKVPANANTALVATWHGTAEPPPSTAPWSTVYDTGVDLSQNYFISGCAIYPGEKIVFFYVDPNTQKLVVYGTCTVDPPTEPECDLLGTQVASSSTNGWHTQTSGSTPSPVTLTVPLIAKYAYEAA